MLDYLSEQMEKGRNVQLRDFGCLNRQVIKQRLGRNPRKPEIEVIIPSRVRYVFKHGKELEKKLNK